MSHNCDGRKVQHQNPSLLFFALDKEDAAKAEVEFKNIIKAQSQRIALNKKFIPAYVGEFFGYCFIVALGVASNALYDVCLKLLRSASKLKLKRGFTWISFELAEAIVHDDMMKRLKIKTFERVQGINLEKQEHSKTDITAPFHMPDKGYVFLMREPNGKKHYYEISTDGLIICYKRYSRKQKSIIELAGGN